MNIYLLGATGSIGTQTLEILKEYNYKLVAFSSGKNIALTETIISEFLPELVSVQNEEDAVYLRGKYPDIEIVHGEEGLVRVATMNENDGLLINALVGFVGLKPTIAAIKAKKKIALANKETLVVAGEIIMPLVAEYGVELLPIDSEHSAILQCMKHNEKDVKKVVITASGGSFREYSRTELKDVTPKDALRHPNWSMGDKITIDSATMMNKGFEVIEAHHLFGLSYEQIETIYHPESIVHSMVEFQDGSILSQMGEPTMRVPIVYALHHPDHKSFSFQSDLSAFQTLHFGELSLMRYPLLQLAYDVGKAGGVLPCVMNAANEAAVQLFLESKISFLEIEDIVMNAVRNFTNTSDYTLEDLIEIDASIKYEIYRKF